MALRASFLLSLLAASSMPVAKATSLLDCADECSYGPEDILNWLQDDLDWNELQEDQKEFLAARRWTERFWDCRVEEEALLSWDELSEQRKRIWNIRGWNKERWEQEDHCQVPMQMSTPKAFKPLLVNISVPTFDALAMDALQQEDTLIRVVDGYSNETNEDFTARLSLKEIVSLARNGTTTSYLHLEEGMQEKRYLQEKIGDKVIESLLQAIKTNPDIQKSGLWNPAFEQLEKQDYDWALFLGGKGTKSPTHYDSDIFNFLYLVEGKKRFVILPNDERTAGTFETWQNDDGGTGWARLDLLDRSKPLPEHAVEIEISAGQGLIVPYVSWHAVENLEASLAYAIRVVD